MIRIFTYVISLLILSIGVLSAQSLAPDDVALANLKAEFADFGLTQEDVAELRISDDYTSSNIRHIYVQQYYQGVPVYNAIAGMHFKNDQLVYRTSNFSTGFAAQQPSVTPAIAAAEALVTAASRLDVTRRQAPVQIGGSGKELVFSWPEISREPITAQLIFADINGKIALSWQVYIDQINTPDLWLTQIDALTGSPLARYNQTVYCNFKGDDARRHKEGRMHHHQRDCYADVPAVNTSLPIHESLIEATLTDGSVYNVFPFGLEAPLFGARELLSEPANLDASPFGWHDTNGQEGAEFTITRGNNVRAYPDTDNSNSPAGDIDVDGGEELIFDFFYEDFGNLDSILPAAVTQLFYMNNMIHDFTWNHGFDEASGNFQQNNYGNGGIGNDAVQAEAQDGSGTNNANFGTPADGGSGRMQMYVWENGASNSVFIDEPSELAGEINVGSANFGPQELMEPITAKVVVAVDGTGSPELVCEAVTNASDVAGRIALIRRGDCFFEQKALNAQAAGAVGVVICNPENALLNMDGGVDNDDPTIPSVLIEEFRCAEIRAQINMGIDVIITFPASTAPPAIDGDFDNGIVAHEYGHGISNRLVGGPSQAGCLGNQEQMGEGWSDFFALATSPLNGAATQPNGTEPRGIGNFATNRGPDGGGIRRKRYSTDFAINDFTYHDVIISGTPHPLGEIWATTLWDLYWAMVDTYGFDSNLVAGTGGNNLAVELVIEGLKNTNCSPGMVSGRNGILIADFLLNDGANQCLIWEVFARRGLGFLADEVSTGSSTDGIEDFSLDPSCIPTVKLSKFSNVDLIEAGDDIIFTLVARNDKAEGVTNVSITDELPEGITIDASSIQGADAFVINSGSVSFTINGLGPEEQRNITYSVTTTLDLHSIASYFDGAEDGDDFFTIFPLNGEGLNLWQQTEEFFYEGDFAWFVENSVENNDQVIYPTEPLLLEGQTPGVRFYTRYNTEAGWDGGIVEMSTDGITWSNVGNDRIIRGKYDGIVQASAFDETVTDFNAYYGLQTTYFDVIMDFSDMAGQEIYLRWRFGSDGAETAANTQVPGWWVDNIEVMDLFRYNGLATLTTEEGDMAEARSQEGGVVVESMDVVNDVNDQLLGSTQVSVFPNPANDFVKVNIQSQLKGTATVQLLSVDGRVLSTQLVELVNGRQTAEFATDHLASGIYLIQVLGADRIHTEKVTIR